MQWKRAMALTFLSLAYLPLSRQWMGKLPRQLAHCSLRLHAQPFRAKHTAKRKDKRLLADEENSSQDGAPSDDSAYPHRGVVIERLGDKLTVEMLNESGESSGGITPTWVTCVQRSHLSSVSIVPGDFVRFAIHDTTPDLGIVNSVLPRTNLLERPAASSGDLRKRTNFKAICSNLDQVVVVLAAQPHVPLHTVDRYIVTARLSHIPGVLLVINKADLTQTLDFRSQVLDYYRRLHVRIIESSTYAPGGLDALRSSLAGKTSILVGQSGVGKSSLINALLPASNIRVGPLSKDGNFGSHTTSNARLYRLAGGGALVDSPGVREMAVWHYPPAEIALGFEEIATTAEKCKFRDCSHTSEGESVCAVLRAVRDGHIHPRRYSSYKHLISGC